MDLHPTVLNRLLDEIERLRGVLRKEHASHCAMLRETSECTCGCLTRATAMMLENLELRAKMMTLEKQVSRQRQEIARMDAEVARARQPSLVITGDLQILAA